MSLTPPPTKIFLGVTGASGALYGIRTLQMLVQAGVEVGLCYSGAARRVLFEETGISLQQDPTVLLAAGQDADRVSLYPSADIGAPPASGTALGQAAVVAPCSLDTLAAIAGGRADKLVPRAAQVALKEGLPLLLVPRETPLSRIHLDQLSKLAWAGATIVPACPGFYHDPQSVLDLVDHVCAKLLNLLGLPQDRLPAWDGGRGKPA
jgi:4-hydroxy-3-polyprenylbenzoate decarboxylase